MGLTELVMQVSKAKRARLADLHARPLEELRREGLAAREKATRNAFRAAIARSDRLHFIAEIRRVLSFQDLDRIEIEPAELALAYSQNGAAAISVLTEEDYFHGSLEDLKLARTTATVPILRRDLILDPRQVYETAIAGADALLLIASALDETQFTNLLNIAEKELGLDALVEVHSTNEMLRVHALGATLIGVNDCDSDARDNPLNLFINIAHTAPTNVLLISERDISVGKQIRGLRALGYSGFFMGGRSFVQTFQRES